MTIFGTGRQVEKYLCRTTCLFQAFKLVVVVSLNILIVLLVSSQENERFSRQRLF